MSIFENIGKYYNKFQNWITKVSYDKLLHAYVSTVMYIIIFGLLNYFNCPMPSTISFIITFGIGVFKEYVIDLKVRKTEVQIGDIFADLVGILIGFISIILIIF